MVSLLLICISQIINDGEPLFLCLLAICVSSSEKSLVHSFASIKIELHIFLLNVVFFIKIVYQIQVLQILAPSSVVCLLIFLLVSFEKQKMFTSNEH